MDHAASHPVVLEALSPRVKQLGHEADHSPPSSAKVMNVQSSQYVLKVWCLIKHRHFTFIFHLLLRESEHNFQSYKSQPSFPTKP
jgi:hypothetical protein